MTADIDQYVATLCANVTMTFELHMTHSLDMTCHI